MVDSPLRRQDTVGTWGVQGYQPFNPKYRKRRKSEGDAISEALAPESKVAELEKAKREGRVYCRECGHFKAWKDLNPSYEKRSADWWMLWFCKLCGNLIKERNLDDRI